jgi:hypothetical protein
MWSYPIIKEGLIYVVDIRNGLYVLEYHGPNEGEVASTGFLEGFQPERRVLAAFRCRPAGCQRRHETA